MIIKASMSAYLEKCSYRISRNFQNSFIFGRASHSEKIIIEHYVSLIHFRKAEDVPNICLFELILSKIFLYGNFTKYSRLTIHESMNVLANFLNQLCLLS